MLSDAQIDHEWERIQRLDDSWELLPHRKLVRWAVAEERKLQGDARQQCGQWLPIDTAPTDSRELILCAKGYVVMPCMWIEEDFDGLDNMGHDGGFMDSQCAYFRPARSCGAPEYRTEGCQPTHWMPIPKGPDVPVAPAPQRQPLSDAQIDAIAESMPGGVDGFLKGWGWRQFARKIEEARDAQEQKAAKPSQ